MLRRYIKDDIERIVELEKNNLGTSLEKEYYERDLSNTLARHYVYEEKGRMIGFISTIFDGGALEVLNFVVDKPFQSLGFGTKILVSVLDELVGLGLYAATLEVRASNISAIHLYEKLGFKRVMVRKGYYSNGEDALVLQKLYDDKRDMINLEAILFSKKDGLKFTSDFKERYCLNYYDLYDTKINSLKDFKFEDYLLFISNWYDENLFKGFELSKTALMHTNVFHFHSLKETNYEVLENDLGDFLEYKYEQNLEYGESYARHYADFCLEQIKKDKYRHFSVRINGKTVGSLDLLEYHHSIFIHSLYVKEEYRMRGIASRLMSYVMEYGKRVGKLEVYLEADLEATPILMYERMNFAVIDTIYEMFLEG